MTPDEVKALREAAEKATPGPWKHYRNKLRPNFGGVINEVQSAERKVPVIQWSGFDNSNKAEAKHAANARFIALANPTTILSLLDALASAEAKLKEAKSPHYYHTADCGLWSEDEGVGCSCALEARLRNALVAAEAKLVKAREALIAVEPHLDAIICYASTVTEHNGNMIAYKVKETIKDITND